MSSSTTSSSPKKRMYITLAPPLTDYDTENSSQSDYDSFNNRDTDICRDTDDWSDSAASTVEDDLTTEVIEFDVVSASSDNGEYLYIEDSSSGSEGFIVDQKIFVLDNKLPTGVSVSPPPWKRRRRFTVNTSSSSDLADTEEDSEEADEYHFMDDPELRPADYWKCVKCKNAQNNPLYRYCEKCYQLRKNYFPPRPKQSKSRPPRKKTRTTQSRDPHLYDAEDTSSDCKSSDEDQPMPKPLDGSYIGKLGVVTSTILVPQPSEERSQLSSALMVVEKEKTIESDGVQSVRLGSGEEVKDQEKKCISNKRSLSHVELSSNDKKSSQTEHEEEDEERDEGVYQPITKKQKLSDVEEDPEETPKPITPVLDQMELRRSMAFMHAKGFCADSGFSSYSSGHESIPSPVENHTLSQHLQQQSQGSLISGLGHHTEPVLLGATSSQVTFSLSRDFYNCDKTSYSDSETYRRSSTKCVVNKGEANAIIKRAQDGLLHADTKDLMGQLEKAKDLEVKHAEQKEEDRMNNLCIICLNEPKDSAFVHSMSLHICCCYKCAIKVWNKKKRCPICNCKVKNVLKCYVH